MTAQTPDVVILDRRPYRLHSLPLEQYFRRTKSRPELREIHTGNYRGYVARWEIFRKRLFLTGLFGAFWTVPEAQRQSLRPDPDAFEPASEWTRSLRLVDLFPDEAPLVPATWVTQRLVAAVGPRLVYDHFGFGGLHAAYRVINVVQGRVWRQRNFDGREWARRMGWIWPNDDWHKAHPMALTFPVERTSEADDEDEEPDNPIDWRAETDENLRFYEYAREQERLLRRPCGLSPR
jgi:hypothetical protein